MRTRKDTLTVSFHTFLPSETFGLAGFLAVWLAAFPELWYNHLEIFVVRSMKHHAGNHPNRRRGPQAHLLRQSGCRSCYVLYRKAELPRETALAALHFTVPRMVGATDYAASQLGLWQEERRGASHAGAARQYTEEDLTREQQAGDERGDFRNLDRRGAAPSRPHALHRGAEDPALAHRIIFACRRRSSGCAALSYCLERSRRRGFARAVHARH